MNAIKTKRELPAITLKFVLVATAFLVSVFLFAAIAHETVSENEAQFDLRVADYLHSQVSGRMIAMMRLITFFGSTKFLLPAYILLTVALLVKDQKRDAIHIAIIGISSTALLFGMKQFYGRTRPELPLLESLKTFSFPSGHALSSFIFCSILAYLVFKGNLKMKYKWMITLLLLVISLLVGVSRIVLRMHYATDVIAGFCLGIAWVIVSFWLMRKTEEK